jgi:hypothetical protein
VPVGRSAGFEGRLAALPADDREAFHFVTTRAKDTRAGIAASAEVTGKQLAWYNPALSEDRRGRLRPGQSVRVPSAAVVAAARDVPDPSIEIYGRTVSKRVHVVRSGETLDRVARRYGLSVASLKAMNGLRRSAIFPGQALIVRGGSKASAAKTKSASSRSARVTHAKPKAAERAAKHRSSTATKKRKHAP